MSALPGIALLSSLTPEIAAEIIRIKARGRVAPDWGAGKLVISFVAHRRRIIAVEAVYYSLDLSVTVHDFLIQFMKDKLDPAWGIAELEKSYGERHPVLQWHHDNATRWRQLRRDIPGGITLQSRPTGPILALYAMAYDLFTVANNRQLDEKLLGRLKDKDQFQGARYELYARAIFLRAGFVIELENEDDRLETHCEFNATSKQSGASFSVEAKSRHRPGLLGQPGVREPEESIQLDFGKLLSDALGKCAKHMRIVLIDVNLPASDPAHPVPHWFDQLKRIVERKEWQTLEDGSRLPACYLIITNHPYHYGDAKAKAPNARVTVTGFRIAGYRELTHEQQWSQHPVIGELHRAFSSNSSIPVTFPQHN